MTLEEDDYPKYPRQIHDTTHPYLPTPADFTFDYACTGVDVQFALADDNIYDSIVWHFEDPLAAIPRTLYPGYRNLLIIMQPMVITG